MPHKENNYKTLAIDYEGIRLKQEKRLQKPCSVVLVEYSSDENFWRKIFTHYNIDEKQFLFRFHTRTQKDNNASGSGVCLSFHKQNLLRKELFICIDSDFRYIKQEENIDIQHFIFQTYTYSIENHLSYAELIDSVLENSIIETENFTFSAFLKTYSNTIWELFLWFVEGLVNNTKTISLEAFLRVIHLKLPSRVPPNENITDLIQTHFQQMQQEIEMKLALLKQNNPNFDISTIESYLQKLGIHQDNVYLYIRGHNLWETITKPILGKIKNQAVHNEQDTLKRATISQIDWEESLLKYFPQSQYSYNELSKIENDIRLFFS